MAKRKFPRILTPVGTAVFPRLNKPDDKFDADGVYSVKLRLTPDEAEDFIEKLEALYEEHYQQCLSDEGKKKLKKAPLPWGMEEDKDTGEETGNYLINCKMKAVVRPKGREPFDKKPVLVDSQGVPISLIVGGGSRIQVCLEVNRWFTALGVGMTLWPVAVQVIQLSEPGTADPASFGFETHDDGFSVKDGTFEDAAKADAEGDDSGDDDTDDF